MFSKLINWFNKQDDDEKELNKFIEKVTDDQIRVKFFPYIRNGI